MDLSLPDYWFTNRVIAVLRAATERVIEMGHEHVEPRHILWGILNEGEGVGCAMLDAMGVDRAKTVAQLTWSMPAAGWEHGEDGVPYTKGAKQVLHLALAAERQLDDPHVGTEHLLLGLLMQERRASADGGLPLQCTLEAALVALRRVDPARAASVQRWIARDMGRR